MSGEQCVQCQEREAVEVAPGCGYAPGRRGPKIDPERLKLAMSLRQTGMTLRAIGETLGVSRQCIQQLFNRDRYRAYANDWKRRRRAAQRRQP